MRLFAHCNIITNPKAKVYTLVSLKNIKSYFIEIEKKSKE